MIILKFIRFASYTSLAFSPQTNTAGARGSQWGWDDEDEDMGGLDAPEIEYKVSNRTCPNLLASQMMINLHRRRRFTIALLLRKKTEFLELKGIFVLFDMNYYFCLFPSAYDLRRTTEKTAIFEVSGCALG